MNIFYKFKKPSRSLMPLMYYEKDRPIGEIVNDEDFPEDFAKNIILFCQRLNEMGVFEEDKIVRFEIQGMLNILARFNILKGIEIKDFNIAQVAFGYNYVRYWYEDRESEPYIRYMIPAQIAFYHTEKEDNYYLSLIFEGIDLCKNKVFISNKEKSSEKIGKGEPAKLKIKQMNKLKSAFHLLFTYLKYKIIINADKLGYNLFIENFSKNFCKEELSEDFIKFAKQYFSLNTEKKERYDLAYRQMKFTDFFDRLVNIYDMGINIENGSFKKYSNWLERTYDIQIKSKDYNDCFEFFSDANRELERIDKSIYLWDFNENFTNNKILIGDRFSDINNEFNIEIIKFDESLKYKYMESIKYERTVRQIGKEFYKVLGIENIDEVMWNIQGFNVLDTFLYEKNYIINIDSCEDIIYEFISDFFNANGFENLMEDLSSKGKNLDEIIFDEDDEITAYDRMTAYAKEIKKRGKLLVYLDTETEFYNFVIIDNKQKFIDAANKLIDIGEIVSYTIFE